MTLKLTFRNFWNIKRKFRGFSKHLERHYIILVLHDFRKYEWLWIFPFEKCWKTLSNEIHIFFIEMPVYINENCFDLDNIKRFCRKKKSKVCPSSVFISAKTSVFLNTISLISYKWLTTFHWSLLCFAIYRYSLYHDRNLLLTWDWENIYRLIERHETRCFPRFVGCDSERARFRVKQGWMADLKTWLETCGVWLDTTL